ncbi:MAG: hypothetical protein KatS3mg031_0933 [Chitinophagales bacterium]|nr:MAG: hypothetical protein KatS3mg031_0933 [Chitinophagales bacterium]
MKKLLPVIFLLGICFCLQAADVKEFQINGLKVIFKTSPKEVISVRLFVLGGTANYPKEKEGIEALAFKVALEGGTLNLSKTAFHTEAEKMGLRLSSSSTYDYGTLSMTCVRMFWDESWNLFTDAVMHPAFEENAFNLIRDQLVSAAKMAESDPDNHLRNLAMQSVFKGKNYAKIPDGSPATLQALSLNEAMEYYRFVLGKQRCFLVVVGNIREDDLVSKIETTLARLPEGQPVAWEQPLRFTRPAVYMEARDIATNYIRGLMNAPHISTKEGIAMQVAMSIVQDRFFVELRTKRSLSYAPSAFYATGVIHNPYSVIYISTQQPVQSVTVMTDIISTLRRQGFTQKDIQHKRQSFLTHYYLEQETSSAQSLSLGMAEIAGSYNLAETLTDRVNALTLTDLNEAFRKHTNVIQWVYLGKPEAITAKDFKQPE